MKRRTFIQGLLGLVVAPIATKAAPVMSVASPVVSGVTTLDPAGICDYNFGTGDFTIESWFKIDGKTYHNTETIHAQA